MVQEIIKLSGHESIYSADVVYFIQSEEFVKIGQTGNLANRLFSFKTHNPHPMYIIGLIKGATAEEKFFHEKFKHLYIKNEWFQYEKDIKDFFNDFEPINLEIMHDRVILQAAMTNTKWHARTIKQILKKYSQNLNLLGPSFNLIK